MNGCHNAIDYMYQYIDEELTPARRARIKLHLRRCNECPDAFQFEQQLKAKIHDAGKATPPPELFANLRALIEEERNESNPDC
jgi:mycothiol system anti-sigma-R factor